MEFPIVENGRRVGVLRARREGLYTIFEARLPARAGLTRLYLAGGGETRLLGLMEPRAGGLYLCRRLSRAQLPPVIEYAAASPGTPGAAPPKPHPGVPDGARRSGSVGEDSPGGGNVREADKRGAEKEEGGSIVQFSPQGGNGTVRASSDAEAARGELLLPCDPRLARDARLRTRTLAGKTYLVFRR